MLSAELRLWFGHLLISAVEFGGENDLLAAPAALRKPTADDLLGDAFAHLPAVDVGGIEEVDARVDRGIHDAERVSLGRLGTEVHRPQTKPADLGARAPKLSKFHGDLRSF